MPNLDLERFIEAQADIYGAVLDEIRRGRKSSHWMWFIFPQLRGLGRSGTARFYGLEDVAHARAYLAHAVLGARYRECAAAVAQLQGKSARDVFGSPDDLKLRSSLTLFEAADPNETLFGQALEAVWAGSRDVQTLAMLGKA